MSSVRRHVGRMAEASRSRARQGLTRIHRSLLPDHRVLLLDSRRDGLPARVEGALADEMCGTGMHIDLDALSDPRGVLRVLDQHPEALDDYDVVVAIAPSRTDWTGSRAALVRVLQRLSSRMPTLLVDDETHADAVHGPAAPSAAGGTPVTRLRLPLTLGTTGAARRISEAVRGVLLRAPERRSTTAPLLVQLPEAASQLRASIGGSAVGRLERIVEIAREQFGLDAAEVNLLRDDLVVTVASAGAQPRTLSVSDSLCTLALQNAGITVLADTWLDPEACRRPPTYEPDAVRFYAGCPIRSRTGEPIGVLCLWDHAPHDGDDLDLALLQDLALLAEGELIHA